MKKVILPFSIVIPLYNKEVSISRAIKSILQQTHTDFELIIINDGSTDNSTTEAAKIKDERIRIINQENAGVSAARNRGTDEAKHDYISYLDADDWWDENYLEEMKNLILDFPDAVAFGSSYEMVECKRINKPAANLPDDFRGEIKNYSKFVYDSVLKYRNDKSIQNQTLFHSSSITIRKEAFLSSKGFNTKIKFMEDWDLFLRVGYLGKIAFYNKVFAYYSKHSENKSSKQFQLSDIACFNEEIINYYKNDQYANLFWNHVALAEIREYYFSKRKAEAARILKKLDLKNQPFKWIILYKWPYLLASIINKILLCKSRIIK